MTRFTLLIVATMLLVGCEASGNASTPQAPYRSINTPEYTASSTTKNNDPSLSSGAYETNVPDSPRIIKTGMSNHSLVVFQDAIWSWWCEPKVVKYGDKIYSVFLSKDSESAARDGFSDQWLCSYDLKSGNTSRVALSYRYYTDDHNAPALLPPQKRNDPWIVFYTGHRQDKTIRYRTFTESLTGRIEISKETQIPFTTDTEHGVAYAQVWRHNGKILLITRTNSENGVWAYRVSNDNGNTWEDQKTLFSGGAYSYAYITTQRASCNSDIINFVAGDIPGDPRLEIDNTTQRIHAGHILLESGNVVDMHGKVIGNIYNGEDLPIKPEQLTPVYDPRYPDEKTRLFAVSSQDPDHMEILFMNFRDWQGKSDGMYQYAIWTENGFSIRPMVLTGDTIDQASYFGGGDISARGQVCLARESDGKWLVELWNTADDGQTWSVTSIASSETSKIFRPIDITNFSGTALPEIPFFWCVGYYASMRDFDTDIIFPKIS